MHLVRNIRAKTDMMSKSLAVPVIVLLNMMNVLAAMILIVMVVLMILNMMNVLALWMIIMHGCISNFEHDECAAGNNYDIELHSGHSCVVCTHPLLNLKLKKQFDWQKAYLL